MNDMILLAIGVSVLFCSGLVAATLYAVIWVIRDYFGIDGVYDLDDDPIEHYNSEEDE